jgi:type VI protein secretion system component VasF
MAPNREFDGTDYGSGRESPRTLVDLCADAFFLIFHVRSGRDPGQPDTLRKEIALLVEEIDRQAKRLGCAEEDAKAT